MGEVLPHTAGGYVVLCHRDSGRVSIATGRPVMEPCCQSFPRPTEELAIQAWCKLWEEDPNR